MAITHDIEKMEGSETGRGAVWTGGCGWKIEGGKTGCVDGDVDGSGTGARLGMERCGGGCGWKMEGSETGCGRVWIGVRIERVGLSVRIFFLRMPFDQYGPVSKLSIS